MQDQVNPEERRALLGGAPVKASPYDFRQVPSHNKAQLRSLRLLHESFCGPLARTLGAVSGLQCKAALESLEPLKAGLPQERAHVCASSGRNRFYLGLERAAGWALLERLLGGKGAPGAAPERPHSEIEKRVLLQLLLKPLLGAYRDLWARVAPLQFSLDQFAEADAAAAPGSLEAVFVLDFGGQQGRLAFVLPPAFLKPLMPELDMTKLLSADQEAPAGAAAGGAMLGVPVNLRIFLGRIDIKLRDLKSLSAGDVLRLDARPEDEVTVEVEGQPRFAAKVGRIGNSLGAQIVRSLEAAKGKDGDKNGNAKR